MSASSERMNTTTHKQTYKDYVNLSILNTRKRLCRINSVQYIKCLMVILVVNLVVFIYLMFSYNLFSRDQYVLSIDGASHYRYEDAQHIVLAKEITVIIREFENFENRINETVKNFKSISPYMTIVIAADNMPYPPLPINFSQSVHLVNLQLRPESANPSTVLKQLINTPYILFVPDGVNLTKDGAKTLVQIVQKMKTRNLIKALAIPVGPEKLRCPGMDVHLRTWTVNFYGFDGGEGMCDFVQGDHALLIQTDDLFELTSPFERPLYVSLYMQMTLRRWKTATYKGQVFTRKSLFKNYRDEWKHKNLEEARLEESMRKFGIKRVVYDKRKSSYYGCTRETERCFGTVVNDMPEFLYLGKWTPPCCLKAIRETARHVFHVLEGCSVRYWLEGGSLLGAARNKDIIPWDYDVDIGVYKDDLEKCDQFIKLSKQKGFTDNEGFRWERATEGEFFRVHYSEVNRNHVDIFPFFPSFGVMTKNTWFKTHRQDTEFPEHYLKPLTKVEFIGMNVSAPNNIKNFLEFKFGKGVIESPKFPNSQTVFGG